jgi:hypothetical protein
MLNADDSTTKGLLESENSRTITVTKSELNLLISGLVVFEREQLRLANLAQEEGSQLEADARRLSASMIKRLADKISDLPHSE